MEAASRTSDEPVSAFAPPALTSLNHEILIAPVRAMIVDRIRGVLTLVVSARTGEGPALETPTNEPLPGPHPCNDSLEGNLRTNPGASRWDCGGSR